MMIHLLPAPLFNGLMVKIFMVKRSPFKWLKEELFNLVVASVEGEVAAVAIVAAIVVAAVDVVVTIVVIKIVTAVVVVAVAVDMVDQIVEMNDKVTGDALTMDVVTTISPGEIPATDAKHLNQTASAMVVIPVDLPLTMIEMVHPEWVAEVEEEVAL